MTDDPTQALTEEQLYDIMMSNRTKRLAKLVELKAPKVIIAAETLMVMKAAVGYCGDTFGQQWQQFLLRSVRMAMARCIFCGGVEGLEHAAGMCKPCMDAAMKEDEDSVCDNYKLPDGVLGGPCMNCGASQPEHVAAREARTNGPRHD